MNKRPSQAERDEYESFVRAATGKRKPIAIKPSHKGKLHEDSGVAKGSKIPAKKIAKATHSSDLAERKRAIFAQNAAKWDRGG